MHEHKKDSAIRIVCLKLWKPFLCEATKPKDESVFDTRFEASIGFIKRSCRGAVRVGLKPIAASHFRLFFEDFISTGSQKTGKCASSTLTRLTQNWFPKFQAKKCGSQTMLISNNEKEAFPNISKQFHLLLNLFDVHAFRLHHLPVRYAIFL